MALPLAAEAPHCLYPETAPPGPELPPLRGEARAEVAIVGGGYTGLSTALHLAERGVAVTLLEAHEPGWGASGRNGGQVNAGLKHEPDEVERDYGPVFGPRLVALAGDAPAALFALVERLGIACEAKREGTLRATQSARLAPGLADSAAQWQRRGVAIELWDAGRMAAATGAQGYVAGAFDRRGGSVNPLALARGMAGAAAAAGATIHAATPAVALDRERSGWRITTPGGALRADRVVVATDGYSGGLVPGLRRSIVPIYSSIVATEPLPPALLAEILPRGGVVYEMGEVTLYYRRDAAGRLLVGGRGRQRRAAERADYRHLVADALRRWPGLGAVTWTHWWNGQFALTPDFYPRLHAPAPGLFVGLGYSGRGVALATAFGGQLAAAATGTPAEALALPLVPIPRIPLHRFWRLGVALRVALARWRDAR
jgi:glycine/D-amino acid oxidase-like deaminating enzyme